MDKLLKALVFDAQMKLAVLDTTYMVNDAIKLHNLSPLSAVALGQALTVGTFMSSELKNDGDKLSINVVGNGVGGRITVCGDGKLNMRGSIANVCATLPLKSDKTLDVEGCIGNSGRITIVKSMGLKKPYSGSSKLEGGGIAENFVRYYTTSEQIPTLMTLGVDIGDDGRCLCSYGIVLQALPGVSAEVLTKSKNIIDHCGDISVLMCKYGLRYIVKKFFGDINYEEYFPKYKCFCSSKKIKSALKMLGKTEIAKLLEEDEKIEVDCEFCDKKYVFYKEDFFGLF